MQRVQQEDLEDLKSFLLPSIPFSHTLWHLLFINPNYSLNCTQWAFHRRQDKIVGALVYDERDDYWTLWGSHPDDVLPVLKKTFDDSNILNTDLVGVPWQRRTIGDISYTHLFGRIDEALVPALSSFMSKKSRPFISEGGYDAWVVQNPKSIPLPSTWDDNVIVDQLVPEDSDLVNQYWTYRSSISGNIARECIVNRPSVAVRVRSSTDADFVPVSWGVLRTDYSIGMVHTLESHRSKGYGKRVVRDLTAAVASTPLALNYDVASQKQLYDETQEIKYAHPFDFIAPGNTASESLHRSLGYERDRKHFWIRI